MGLKILGSLGYILKTKNNFTLLLYIPFFWLLVSGILNEFNSYKS